MDSDDKINLILLMLVASVAIVVMLLSQNNLDYVNDSSNFVGNAARDTTLGQTDDKLVRNEEMSDYNMLEESRSTERSRESLTVETFDYNDEDTAPWNEEGLIKKQTTSTCTIKDGEFYRMYFSSRDHGMIKTWISDDGINWDENSLKNTGIEYANADNFPDRSSVRNPAVLKLSEENYIMIFEGNSPIEKDEHSGNPSFFRATSIDGVTFSIDNKYNIQQVLTPNEIENNWMSVADLVYFENQIWMYYVADYTKIFYATSDDEGVTWKRGGEISISGLGIDTSSDKIVDPDVISNSDGTLTLFFAYAEQYDLNFGTLGIYSASSEDGINFITNGQVITTEEGEAKLDPDVIFIEGEIDQYRMYFGYKSNVDDTEISFNLYSATSP